MLYYVLNSVFVVVCLLLLLVVLLQQGKGGDMASAFGGGGSQTAFGARGGATVLSKATVILGTLFMIVALVLAIIGRQQPGSILSGIEPPSQTEPEVPPSESGTLEGGTATETDGEEIDPTEQEPPPAVSEDAEANPQAA